jgi:hypothetical protein
MTDPLDKETDRLFDEGLLPLAKALRAKGVTFLEARLSKDASTYFVARPRRSMARADFETGGCASPETVESDLVRLWSNERDSALARLAPRMAKLARALRRVEDDAGEVSTAIFVMY